MRLHICEARGSFIWTMSARLSVVPCPMLARVCRMQLTNILSQTALSIIANVGKTRSVFLCNEMIDS